MGAQLTKWAQRHHVGGLQPQDWEQLITTQWQLHYPESQYLLSMQGAKFIISVVRGLWCKAEIMHLMIYMFSVPTFIGKC